MGSMSEADSIVKFYLSLAEFILYIMFDCFVLYTALNCIVVMLPYVVKK